MKEVKLTLIRHIFFLFVFIVYSSLAHSSEKHRHEASQILLQADVSPFSILVQNKQKSDPEWMLWQEYPIPVWWDIFETGQQVQILRFSDVNSLLTLSSQKAHQQILNKYLQIKKYEWRQDAIKSYSGGFKSPSYLEEVIDLLSPMLENFVYSKEKSLITRKGLVKHAYSILFLIRSCNLVDRPVANNNLYNPEIEADWAETFREVAEAAEEAGIRSDYDRARESSMHAAWDASHKYWLEVQTVATVGVARQTKAVVYGIAEQQFLVFYIQNFYNIIKRAYMAGISNMRHEPLDNVFDSLESWVALKMERFQSLTDEQKFFVSIWIRQLDRIAAKIDLTRD